MDRSFACPECGSEVQVRGLAPGRQVRCGFCHRLLEVPFLPRAADAPWKRRRFTPPKWVAWAWVGLAAVAAVIVVAGAFQFLRRQYDSIQERSISQLLDSSRRHESGGRLGEALIDLDSALELARSAGGATLGRHKVEQKRRPELARRDAELVLDRLGRIEPSSFRVGDWLNLIARADKDRDLAPLVNPISKQFQSVLGRQVAFDLAAARQSLQTENIVASFRYCEQTALLFDHLAPQAQPAVRSEAETLVIQLVCTRGVKVEAPQGRFVFGSKSYFSDMLPILEHALESKGYLPGRESSPWRYLWNQALYHLRLDISELQEGNYLSSANRLTRIEAHLSLTSRGETIWQTTPTARSQVPLPKLPAYLANRVAISPERSEEFERLLYDNARSQIDEKFSFALSNMPACSSSARAKKP
jgi:hypothetical protein